MMVFQRWFAWHPVWIVDRWYWLQYVARDQIANRPAKYVYARYKKRARDPWNFWNRPPTTFEWAVMLAAFVLANVLIAH